MLRAQDFGVKDVLDTRSTRLGKLFMAKCRGQPERMKTERTTQRISVFKLSSADRLEIIRVRK